MPLGLTTAPINPAPQWPAGYVEALRKVGAQEKTMPFCNHERFRGIALPDGAATATVLELRRSRPVTRESTTVEHYYPSPQP